MTACSVGAPRPSGVQEGCNVTSESIEEEPHEARNPKPDEIRQLVDVDCRRAEES
jgi:hypothetical protein